MNLLLSKAIVAAMIADTGAGSLVALSGHTSSDRRLGRDKPVVKGKTPFVGVEGMSAPFIGVDVTHFQKAIVDYHCYSTSEVTAGQLADRIETLLNDRSEDDSGSDPNTRFWDMSSTDISTRMTRFLSRMESEYDNETEVWTITVVAHITWVNQPCPPPS